MALQVTQFFQFSGDDADRLLADVMDGGNLLNTPTGWADKRQYLTEAQF